MPQKSWERRLCTLIKKLKPPVDAGFRNDYAEAVQNGADERALDAQGVRLLEEARERLEAWVAPQADPILAFAQWVRLFEAGTGTLPVAVLAALLRRFPQGKSEQLDWGSFIVQCPYEEHINVLLDRGLLGGPALRRLVEQRFDELYKSVALDVFVERSALPNPRAVWRACLSRGKRRDALMKREALLVRCWACDSGEGSDTILMAHLLSSLEDRLELLRYLLVEHHCAARLAWHLASGLSDGSGSKEVLVDWVSVCASEMERGAPDRAATAAVILAILRLSPAASWCTPATGGAHGTANVLSQASEAAAFRILRHAEGRTDEQPAGPILLFADELTRAMRAYIDWLPLGTRLGEDSPETRLRVERYLAAKRVIDVVLRALETTVDGGRLRGELEVALYNYGVRPLGQSGQVVAFDGRIHRPEEPGMIAGDPAVITSPGRSMDEGTQPLVLVKARVKPFMGEAPAGALKET